MVHRRLLPGALGLLLATTWAMAGIYQQHNIPHLFDILRSAAPLYPIKASLGWSLIDVLVTALLILPMVIASVGCLFGTKRAPSFLRAFVVIGLVVSVGTVLNYVQMVAPVVSVGGPLFPYEQWVNLELAAALIALVIQLALIHLLRRTPNEPFSHVTSKAVETPAADATHTASDQFPRLPKQLANHG